MLNKISLPKRLFNNILFIFFISSFVLSVLHYFLLDRQIYWDETSYLYLASTPSIKWAVIWKTQVFGYLTFLRFLTGITGKGYLPFIVLKIFFCFLFSFSAIFVYKIFQEFNVSNFLATISTFFFITSPVILYVSPRFLSEGPSFCCAIIGCYFFISWVKYETKNSLILGVVFVILTFSFRPPMLILPFGLAIALICFRLWEVLISILIKRYVLMLIILIIPVLLLLIPFQLFTTLTGWIFYHTTYSRQPFYVNIVRVGFVAGFLWPLAVIGFLKRSRLTYMLLSWALICSVPVVILNIGHIAPRLLISAVPSISLASGIGLEHIFSFLQNYRIFRVKQHNSIFSSRIHILISIIILGNFILTYPRYEIIITDYEVMMKSALSEYENPVFLITLQMDFEYLTFVYPNENIYYVETLNVDRAARACNKYGHLYLKDKTDLINLTSSSEFDAILYVVRVYRTLNSYYLGWPANENDISLQFVSKFNTIIIYELEIVS